MAANDATRSSSSDASLFPEIEPYATGRIALDAVHVMQWETCGNKNGVPLVFLHGGPGGGCLPHHRRFYDPAFWNIVLYDQRGAGRSTPAAALADNTTPASGRRHRTPAHGTGDRALAGLRRIVGLDAGARLRAGAPRSRAGTGAARHLPRHRRPRSTGSCTACAISSPRRGARSWKRCRRASATICWATTIAGSPTAIRRCICRQRARGTATKARARRCCPSPIRCAGSTAMPRRWPLRGSRRTTSSTRASSRRTSCWTAWRRFATCPCTIVQGRYDIVCPPVTADALARAWPEAEYIVVPDAGHSVREPGITRELVAAVKRMQARAST